MIRQALGLEVSLVTIRRRLTEADILHHVPAVKERLTDRHRADRLAFAREFVLKEDAYWDHTIFRQVKTKSRC